MMFYEAMFDPPAAKLSIVIQQAKSMTRVRVEYFAILREHVGQSNEDLETEAQTVADLFEELDSRYGFPQMAHMKVAINDEFSEWESELADGDSVVFIPPVAGG